MKKYFSIAAMMLLCLPCLLALTESNEGGVTVWNFVGLAWMALLIVGAKWCMPRTWKKIINEYTED